MNSFDERAATWDDDPAKLVRASAVASAIRDRIKLDGSERLLDYGAGTGLVSEALQHAVGPITLADPSAGMRDVMLAKIAAGTIADARVWNLDLESATPPGDQFDLIVTVMTLHHVGDVDLVLSRFAALLAVGGRLCVVDLEKEDGSFHGPDVEVHHGFDPSTLATSLGNAGFTDVEIRECHQVEREAGTFPIFLATGRLSG